MVTKADAEVISELLNDFGIDGDDYVYGGTPQLCFGEQCR